MPGVRDGALLLERRFGRVFLLHELGKLLLELRRPFLPGVAVTLDCYFLA